MLDEFGMNEGVSHVWNAREGILQNYAPDSSTVLWPSDQIYGDCSTWHGQNLFLAIVTL